MYSTALNSYTAVEEGTLEPSCSNDKHFPARLPHTGSLLGVFKDEFVSLGSQKLYVVKLKCGTEGNGLME